MQYQFNDLPGVSHLVVIPADDFYEIVIEADPGMGKTLMTFLTIEQMLELGMIKQKILICGDYDADGMTSTALLMRSLRYLGGMVNYAIPSRMDEGYGINLRMVEEFHAMAVAVRSLDLS